MKSLRDPGGRTPPNESYINADEAKLPEDAIATDGRYFSIFHLLANYSVFSPLFIILLAIVATAAKIESGFIAGVLIVLFLLGIPAGVIALCGIRFYGKERILAKAITGIALVSLFSLVSVAVYKGNLGVTGKDKAAALQFWCLMELTDYRARRTDRLEDYVSSFFNAQADGTQSSLMDRLKGLERRTNSIEIKVAASENGNAILTLYKLDNGVRKYELPIEVGFKDGRINSYWIPNEVRSSN